MPKTFSNMDELKKYLQPKIAEALQGKVAEKVKEVEQRNIKQTVYDAYTPNFYERRKSGGGLIDENNMEAKVIGGDTLEVRNKTPLSPWIMKNGEPYNYDYENSKWELDKLTEYGHSNGKDFYPMKPRPFTKNTVEELKKSKAHIKALQEGLEDLGVASDIAAAVASGANVTGG